MIRLQERLPDFVVVRGRKIKCDFDFRNVLRMMDILDDELILPEAKAYLAAKCITKRAKHPAEVLREARKILFPESNSTDKDAPRITDFDQDAPLIRAAFRQVYGIDLFTAKIHWIEFSELLHELPEGSRYIEVVGIRSRPLPAPTKYNQKEREWLMRAKAAHALHMSDAEQEKYYENAVKNVFSGLMRISKGSEKHG